MLRETLKQEIDTLSEAQLVKLAELLRIVKAQTHKTADAIPFWQRATPAERAQDLLNWTAQLPRTGVSLTDEACDRGNMERTLQQLNEIYSEEPSEVDPALSQMQMHTLSSEDW